MSKPYDNSRFSFRARLRSFKYAARGIVTLLKQEHNARIHLVAAILAILVSLWLNISPAEWSVIIILIAAVFSLEALNSAIEALADKVSPGFSPLIGKAKDLAAAAVLIMAVAAVIIAAVIFIPKLILL